MAGCKITSPLPPLPNTHVDQTTLLHHNLPHQLTTNSSSAMKQLLTQISTGYIDVITQASKKPCTKNGIDDKQKTLENIRKRINEVQRNISIVRSNNKKLKEELLVKGGRIQSKGSERRSSPSSSSERWKFRSHPGMDSNATTTRKFCSLLSFDSPSDGLDTEKLQTIYQNLSSEINCLKTTLADKFVSKSTYKELREQFALRQKQRDQEGDCYTQLKECYEDRKQQVDILKEELGNLYPTLPAPKESTSSSDPFLPLLQQNLFESVEPDDCEFVSACIKYVNEFNRHFNEGSFNVAADLAISSPKGILRNYSTFLLFKNADISHTERPTPSYTYCNTLMSRSYSNGTLCEQLCREVIACAIHENDAELAEHWLQSCIITLTVGIGDMLVGACKCSEKCTCQWTGLALQVYSRMKHHRGVLLCHLKLYNFQYDSEFTKKCCLQAGEFKELVSGHPEIQLSCLMCDPPLEIPGITLAGVVRAFLDAGNDDRIVELLQCVHERKLHKESLVEHLLKETALDEVGEEGWELVMGICRQHGCDELAEELSSSLVVRLCLDNAATACLLDYIS